MARLNNFSRAILAIAMMLVVGLPSHAHDFVVDGIYYNYIDKDAKTVEVTHGSYPGIGTIEYGNDVTIPSNVTYDGVTYFVTTIKKQAFYNCTDLTSVTIPNSVSIIGEYVFSGCTGLTSITIPNSVTTIGEYAFGGCIRLTSITIPNSVTTIDNQAFAGCTGLTSVTIPNSVSTIDKYAFSGCRGLTSITIPNSVTTIGEHAFGGCTNLSSIIVENGNSNYDSRDNCNAIIETTSNSLILGCKNTIIPNSVTSIGDYAFYGCSSLTSIYIPNSVTSIGNDAFDGCKLPILHLPKSVTYVGLYNTCADICYCYNPTPPTGGGYTSDRLYVPKGSMTAYATAEGWKMAKQIMEFDVDDAEKPILTIAYPEGGVIKQEVDNGELLKLQIVPANGWKCHSVTFNSTDVTNQIDANGYYNTPAITANSQLNIVFVKNDGGVANALIENDIKVHVTGNIVTISGADEFSNVEIYNTAGATIYNGIDKSITLDCNGIYILSVEGCTFKFSM